MPSPDPRLAFTGAVGDPLAAANREIAALQARIASLEGNDPAALAPSAVAAAEVSTNSVAPADLGGPNLTITVAQPSLIQLMFECEAHTSGAGTDLCRAHIIEAVDIVSPTLIINGGNSLPYVVLRSGNGGNSALGSWLLVGASPGTHTYSIRYSTSNAVAAAFFQNRKLWLQGVIPVKT